MKRGMFETFGSVCWLRFWLGSFICSHFANGRAEWGQKQSEQMFVRGICSYFPSVSAQQSEQSLACSFAKMFVIGVVRSDINLLLLLLYSTKGAISMHALLLCQTKYDSSVGRAEPAGGRLHSA